MNNRLYFVDGLMQSNVLAVVNCFAGNAGSSSIRFIEGIDWTSGDPIGNSGGGSPPDMVVQTQNIHTPRIGVHYIQLLQANASGVGTATAFGSVACGGGIALPQ